MSLNTLTSFYNHLKESVTRSNELFSPQGWNNGSWKPEEMDIKSDPSLGIKLMI